MLEMHTLEMPRSFVDLPEQEQLVLLRAGLYEAGRARLRQLETEIAEAEAQVSRFESRYGISFGQFEAELLPKLDSFEAHEDYNDWFFWQTVLADRREVLAKIREIPFG